MLDSQFYLEGEVFEIARDMLGKVLYTNIDGNLCSGIIVETEAYRGQDDKACHAHNGRRTKRTEIMYAKGGIAYVYFIYGMHCMFNVVTHPEGCANAVLIRAVEPLEGIETMLNRRKSHSMNRLTSGPGNVCKAFGIGLMHNGASLTGSTIWLEKAKAPRKIEVVSTTRVGVDYAGEDALLPWRYYIKGNRWVSKF